MGAAKDGETTEMGAAVSCYVTVDGEMACQLISTAGPFPSGSTAWTSSLLHVADSFTASFAFQAASGAARMGASFVFSPETLMRCTIP